MASRDLSSELAAEIRKAKLRPALLYEGVFLSGASPTVDEYLRLWSGVGTLTWEGNAFLGAGSLLGVRGLDEVADIRAVGFEVTLSGINLSDRARALAGTRKYKAGRLWFAVLTESNEIIGEPYRIADGRFDRMRLAASGATTSLAAQYESRLIDLHRPRLRHYTSVDQQVEHATDEGFKDVASLADMAIQWG